MGQKSVHGLKVVATLEASKGIATLLVCFGLYQLAGYDLQLLILHLASDLRLSPSNHYLESVLDEAGRVTPDNLYMIIAIGTLYAAIRFIESYGLFRGYLWTEWFALVSGAVYLPFEFYEFIKHTNLLSGAVLIINLVVVVYMYNLIMVSKADKPEQLASDDYTPDYRAEDE